MFLDKYKNRVIENCLTRQSVCDSLNVIMNVFVDKRTELLNAIYLNSNFHKEELLGSLDSEYSKRLCDFIKSNDSKALIDKFNEVISYLGDRFSYDAPILLFLQMDENYNLTQNAKKEYPYKGRLCFDAKSKILIDELMQEVNAFANKSNFDKFYKDSQSYYNKQIDKINDCLKKYEGRLKDFIDWFFIKDVDMNDFNINIIMSMASGGCGAKVNGRKIVSETGNVVKNEKGEEIAEILPGGEYGFMMHLCHEICHIYINPITDKLDLKGSKLLGFDKSLTNSEHEGNEKVYINESIIRAIENVFEKELIIAEEAKKRNISEEQFISENYEKIAKRDNQYYSHQAKRGFGEVKGIEQSIVACQEKNYANFEDKYADILSNSLVENMTFQQEAKSNL